MWVLFVVVVEAVGVVFVLWSVVDLALLVVLFVVAVVVGVSVVLQWWQLVAVEWL